MLKRVAMVMVVVLSGAAAAFAQGTPTSSTETRPATTTINGDTGLWFVPTGEVLPAKKWSLSAYRVNFDWEQGFTDVSNWPVTFGYGIGDRAEIFGAWTLVRRIDRDVRPLFRSDQPEAGGIVNDYPFVRQGWSDNQLGDLWLGAKVNLLSQYQQKPAAFALRGMVKLPTAKDDDEGVGSGKVDFIVDAIVSSELNERVELSGFAGFISRGNPDGVAISNGFRWGIGAGLPSRKSLRLTAELHGEAYADDGVVVTTPIVADDGTIAPGTSQHPVAAQRVVRIDVAGIERHLRRGRHQLEPGDEQP